MIKVYVASPYTLGDVAINVHRQIAIGEELIQLGYVPFLPLLAHFQHLVYPHPHQIWMKLDLEWVKCCDILLRLEGSSKGADIEEEEARRWLIPIAYSVEELLQKYPV